MRVVSWCEHSPLVWIPAEYFVIDEGRKRSLAVEIYSVVVVGDYDSHEADQKGYDDVEIWADIWWILLRKWLVFLIFLLRFAVDVQDGLSLAKVGHVWIKLLLRGEMQIPEKARNIQGSIWATNILYVVLIVGQARCC
jgi:hypothetical protein